MTIFLALLFLLLLGAAVAWSVALRNRRRERFIDAYPYAKFLDRRLAERRPELSAAQRAQVFAGLREYFQVCREAKRRMVAMPSQVVDEAWHEFILCTRQYQQFCARGLGRFLHHTPAEAMRRPHEAQEGIKRAWRLACRRQAIDPRSPRALPLLFALDGMLAISSGFVYRLDCSATLAGAKAGSVGPYCAGHIGCGGGCVGGSDGSGSSSDGCGGGGCGGD